MCKGPCKKNYEASWLCPECLEEEEEEGAVRNSALSGGLCCVCEVPTDGPYRIKVEKEMRIICRTCVAELTRGELGRDVEADIKRIKKRKAA